MYRVIFLLVFAVSMCGRAHAQENLFFDNPEIYRGVLASEMVLGGIEVEGLTLEAGMSFMQSVQYTHFYVEDGKIIPSVQVTSVLTCRVDSNEDPELYVAEFVAVLDPKLPVVINTFESYGSIHAPNIPNEYCSAIKSSQSL